jgi:adenylate cyclase
MRGLRGAIAAAFLLIGYVAASQLFFSATGIALRVVYPSLALAFTYVAVSVQHFVAVERETRETRRVLDLYLSPALARELSARPDMLKLGGEKSERTVLFSDIKSFTSISERLDPEDLVELLNLYLGDMTDIVFAHDGMLDKYIGDGLMAVWGAPIPQADHAVLACRAALGMVDRLRQVNEHGASRGWPKLEIRIGLNSGQMVFGNMGSARHLSLTVMGDNVNLGSRLEGINKLYGSMIIASEATVDAAGGEFVMRELDWVRVRGKKQSVRIFELLGPLAERGRWEPILKHFETGLAAYRARRWQEAAEAFARASEARGGDGPSNLYRSRCQQLMQREPQKDWEAVTDFSE